MKRLDSRTVELEPSEQAIYRHFDAILSDGYGIEDAARKALADADQDHLDAAFVEYLSDETLTLNGHNIALTAKGLTLHGDPMATPVMACAFALGKSRFCLLPVLGDDTDKHNHGRRFTQAEIDQFN